MKKGKGCRLSLSSNYIPPLAAHPVVSSGCETHCEKKQLDSESSEVLLAATMRQEVDQMDEATGEVFDYWQC